MQLYENKQEAFDGASGKHYRRNPFGKGGTSFAQYPSADNLAFRGFRYVSEEAAYSDAGEIKTRTERWNISTPEGTQAIECEKDGTVGDTTIMEIIQSLISKHGHQSVNAVQCTTTN